MLLAAIQLRYGTITQALMRALLYVFVAVVCVVTLYPYYVMTVTAFRSNAETNDMYFLHIFPTKWIWSNLKDIVNKGVPKYLLNSGMIAGGATLIAMLCGIPAAYAMARMNFKGKKAFLGFVIMSQMFSPVVLLIGIAQLMSTLKLNDTILGLMLINAAFNQAFTNPNPATQTRYDLQDMFAAGKLAMVIAPNQLPTYVADKGGEINLATANIPANEGKASSSVGVMDRVMAFKDEAAPDQAARDEAIGKFAQFFYNPENYVGWVSMEGFLPAVNSAVGALVEADPSFGAWLDVLGGCQFYPTAKAEWDQVKQGVIAAEQAALAGGSVQAELDALQAALVG